jgi:hypothetical protein
VGVIAVLDPFGLVSLMDGVVELSIVEFRGHLIDQVLSAQSGTGGDRVSDRLIVSGFRIAIAIAPAKLLKPHLLSLDLAKLV